MTDWNAHFNELIAVDHWRNRFEERYPQCTDEVKAGIEVLRQIEANIATVELLNNKWEALYQIPFLDNSGRLLFVQKRRYPFHLPNFMVNFSYIVDKGGLHLERKLNGTDKWELITEEEATQVALNILKDVI
ncbi:hypothetical protein ACK9YZ_20425 [Rhizobium sp. ZK1]|uniref:hypothetical protein n=1 Tax=Rhizobium sp. ZK1 TaxID=3389872 RepID=UPI0039F6A487